MQYDVSNGQQSVVEGEADEIVACPNCRQRLHVPIGKGSIIVTCPKCRWKFDWPFNAATADAGASSNFQQLFEHIYWISLVVGFAGFLWNGHFSYAIALFCLGCVAPYLFNLFMSMRFMDTLAQLFTIAKRVLVWIHNQAGRNISRLIILAHRGRRFTVDWSIVAMCAVGASMSFIAVGNLPANVYTFVRFVVCSASAYSALRLFRHDKRFPHPLSRALAPSLVAVAALFNPFFPVALGRQLWRAVDAGTGCWLLTVTVVLFFVQKSKRKNANVKRERILATLFMVGMFLAVSTGWAVYASDTPAETPLKHKPHK